MIIIISFSILVVFFLRSGVTAGVVVAQVVTLKQLLGAEDLWHYALGFYVILIVVCFLPYPWFPESPKYLYIVAKKTDAARKGEFKKKIITEKLPPNTNIYQILVTLLQNY